MKNKKIKTLIEVFDLTNLNGSAITFLNTELVRTEMC